MSGENWESLITEKGFMRVPRALRLKRKELGITNNEYTILLDYVDYYSFSGTMNPYRHLTEVSGMSERSIRSALTALEKKGLLRRKVSRHGNGRTNGVVFSIDPLVRKLRTIMKKSSPTVGEEIDPYVGEESFRPNTGEEFNKRDDKKNTSVKNTDVPAGGCGDARTSEERMEETVSSATDNGFIRGTGGPCQEAARNDGRPAQEGDAETEGVEAGQIHLARAGKGPHGPVSGEDGDGQVDNKILPNPPGYGSLRRDEPLRKEGMKNNRPGTGAYAPSRWYNEVWRGLYEEAAGQPALTGGREYRAAEMYFRRLRELNPEMEPAEVYGLAGEGAAFMIASQLEGGVFGWMHKPPDICLLASQAQSVEWHLRKIKRSVLKRDGNPHPDPPSPRLPASLSELRRTSRGTSPPPEMGRGLVLDKGSGEGVGTGSVFVKFIEKIREVQDAGQQIERVYGELRGIENASRGGSFEHDAGRGSERSLRQFDPSTSSGRTVERRALRRGRG